MKEFLAKFYENRMGHIIPLVDFNEQGLEEFQELWKSGVEDRFIRMVNAFRCIIENIRPMSDD